MCPIDICLGTLNKLKVHIYIYIYDLDSVRNQFSIKKGENGS